MNFEIHEALTILERTPSTLRAALVDLPDLWLHTRDKEDAWSPFEILGHLIHGEKTDWTERTKILLSDSTDPNAKTFVPFDRFAHLEPNRGRPVLDLLDEFEVLRARNLEFVRGLKLSTTDVARTAIHPALGEVTLHNLYSAWTVHDLGHIAQIHRTMARRYATDVGPWREYMPILDD
jgi:DinB superfamily